MGNQWVADFSQFRAKRYEDDPEFVNPEVCVVWGTNFVVCNSDAFLGHWIIDAMRIQVYVAGLKKTYIVADQDATSIRGIRYLVQSLGCIPVPETPSEHKKFVDCLRYRIKQKRGISIFPEAHIWPYSTHIRPFKDDSFVYPCELEAPVVPVCVTYRKRKFRKKMAPAVTVHVGKPVYPDMSLDLASRRKKLRDHVYYFMLDTSAEDENEEYIAYVRKPAEGEGEK